MRIYFPILLETDFSMDSLCSFFMSNVGKFSLISVAYVFYVGQSNIRLRNCLPACDSCSTLQIKSYHFYSGYIRFVPPVKDREENYLSLLTYAKMKGSRLSVARHM